MIQYCLLLLNLHYMFGISSFTDESFDLLIIVLNELLLITLKHEYM